MSSTPPSTRFSERLLEPLLRLRATGALEPREDAAARGAYRWSFRAAGRPVQVDLDTTVLELRAYEGRETLATGRVPERVMRVLVGQEDAPPATDDGVTAGEALDALRAIVRDWRRRNARVDMEPPRTARHPDGWNNA